MKRPELLLLGLTKEEVGDLMIALRRATDWTDLHDNAAHNGKRWTGKETAFVARGKALHGRLEERLKDFK